MNDIALSALTVIAARGDLGASEKAVIRRFPLAHVPAPSIRAGLAQLVDAGLVRRCSRTRTNGWLFVATEAGQATLSA